MNCFLITSYNRQRSCRKLVEKLINYGDVYLVVDGSYYNHDTWQTNNRLFVQEQGHLGKRYYHETVNKLWEMPQKKYRYYFMIPDDFYPVPRFTEKAIETWRKVRDKNKICLTTYVEQSRIDKSCWTGILPTEYKHFRLTQWTDMCFMCTSKFFDAIGEIPRSKINWRKRPYMGSGIGAHISSTLYREGWNLYQTKRSLFKVQPEALKSEMNPMRERTDPINKPIL